MKHILDIQEGYAYLYGPLTRITIMTKPSAIELLGFAFCARVYRILPIDLFYQVAQKAFCFWNASPCLYINVGSNKSNFMSTIKRGQ